MTTYSAHPLRSTLPVALSLFLAACSPSYVVLLAEDDGRVGQISVTTPAGTTLLDKASEGVEIADRPGKTFAVDPQRLERDFGPALASAPKKPVSFYLYFNKGGTELTAASTAEIPKFFNEIKQRPAPDISVIGHTDTVGSAQDNERLSLDRAKATAELLKKNLPQVISITIDSHGEKNLLVPTPDNTAEPRNRRVEITAR
jgi:peptidoglycan-associated lipoprotein